MSRGLARTALCLLFTAGIFFSSGAPASGAKEENRLFMQEFARSVIGMLDAEPSIRAEIREYIIKNKDRVSEGFGHDPDLVFRLYGEFGLERMNCIRGRYYGMLSTKLNNEERHLFYENAERLDWWVLMIAVEEADSLGIRKTSPPLNFRRPTDMPYNISNTIRKELAPFVRAKLTAGEMNGFSYKNLPCR